MKLLRFPFLTVLLATIFTIAFWGCKKEGADSSALLTSDSRLNASAGASNCLNYVITLSVDKTSTPGKTIFTWTVTNPHPGNGSGVTLQDLSHWDFVPGTCIQDNWKDVLSASYNLGSGWQNITDLTVQRDPSLTRGGCNIEDVFKFDQGTSGSTPTQYRMVLHGNWGTGDLHAYFKSGANTGCCDKTVANTGIGCPEIITCSFSQGYWFANNGAHPDGVHPWYTDANNHTLGLKTVTIGGKVYTNAEGLAIWNFSNSGGIRDSKQAFTQLASIRLSGVKETDAAISGAIATVDGWLGSISKLSPASPENMPNQSESGIGTYGDAKAAAGIISDWITAHHCE